MRLNSKQIAAYTGGQFLVDPIDASALMTGITWDSREVRPGWLYVALPGERVDGHQFVEAALRAGAAGALVTDGPSQSCALLARELGAAIIEVPNTASAITDLARAWRSHLRGRVIGLTGSVGKTTTKNLTRDVCAAYGSVVATKANQNNELGVPRTLLNADPETAVVVVEMGMRGRGQIAELCDFVRPVWGLITNVGESHIELLGSRENIARAKSELFEALPAGVGRAFANLDDDFAAFMAERGRLSERSVALSGFAGHPDAALRGALERESAACDQAVWAEDVSLDAEGRPRFTLCARDAADHDDGALFATVERVPCALSLTGAHNVDNACAAASVGFALGLDLATIAAALGASVPEPGRQEVIAARGGFTVINDAYNASPDSMRASLATFAATDVAGRRIAVLGDMGELGSFAPACHEGVGAAAASHHLDKLICIGELARHIAAGAEAAGMDAAPYPYRRRIGQLMFSLFSAYPTFMIFLGVAIAMVITMVLMPAWIRFLKTSHIGQQVRADGPQSHLVKQGTPTMGGVIMLIAVIVFTLLASVGAPTAELWLLLGATVATGILGLIDDASKVAHERSLGLTPKAKLIGQFLIAAVFVLVAVNLLGIKPTVEIPFVATLDLGVLTTVVPVGDGIAIPWLYLIYCLILLVGLCNAVNLTDGLDGLAAGTVMVVMLVMAAIAFRAGVLEPALFAGALAGACIGFLWFNSHPADIFMGDTGSLALGMALGCLAVVTKTEFVVIIIGGLFVAEALSVMIQVFYYKKTKKRIFLMAPLHHHFEKKGWSETKVVVRFWIVSGMLAACGFVLYFATTLGA